MIALPWKSRVVPAKLWRVKTGSWILGNFKMIEDAQKYLSQIRRAGLDGFIWKIS